MRYSELRAVIEQMLAEGKVLLVPVIDSNPRQGRPNDEVLEIKELHRLQRVVGRLANVPMFRDHFTELFQHQFLNRAENTVRATYQEIVSFRTKLDAFFTAARQTLSLLQAMSEHVDETCARIRLPDSSDFRTAVDDQQKILKALEQVFLAEPFNSTIRLVGWENGSLWLVIALGSALAVEFLGRIVWSAAVVRKKKIEGDLLVEQTRKVGVEADFLEHLSQRTVKAAEDLLTQETKALRNHIAGARDDPEAGQRLKETIKVFADLISRGAQVEPALMEPERAKEVFPDFKTLDTIASKIPQLTDTPSDENQT